MRELVLRGLEIDAVEDEIDVAVVRLDLRMEDFAERVFDGELVEVEVVREDLAFLLRGTREIDPQLDAASRLEPGRVELVYLAGVAVLVNEDRQHGVERTDGRNRLSATLSVVS